MNLNGFVDFYSGKNKLFYFNDYEFRNTDEENDNESNRW